MKNRHLNIIVPQDLFERIDSGSKKHKITRTQYVHLAVRKLEAKSRLEILFMLSLGINVYHYFI